MWVYPTLEKGRLGVMEIVHVLPSIHKTLLCMLVVLVQLLIAPSFTLRIVHLSLGTRGYWVFNLVKPCWWDKVEWIFLFAYIFPANPRDFWRENEWMALPELHKVRAPTFYHINFASIGQLCTTCLTDLG